jgi:dTDP-4-amino-4,6-dideoxygalactose transaminase
MIPLAVPNIGEAEGTNLAECVASTMVSSVGPFVDAFEEAVGKAAGGAPPAVATSAGTTGLHVAFVAVGVLPGDLVLSPSFTFIATANAISHAGAVPWLIDVEPATWTIDPDKLSTALDAECERDAKGILRRRACGRRVAAIAPVYTMGHPPNMPAIAALAKAYGIAVVSDAAAAIGARIGEMPIAAHGATLSVFSFNGNKTITCGGGGAVVGLDDDLLSRVRHLSTTARRGPGYDHDEVGFNYRMTNLQAAVGCAQMARLDAFLAAKQRIATRYANAFSSIRGFEAFPSAAWAENTRWLSGIFVPDRAADTLADAVAQLREASIDVRPFWRPIHQQKPYHGAPRESLSTTEKIWEKIIPLPCSTHLTTAEQDVVIFEVRRIFNNLQ